MIYNKMWDNTLPCELQMDEEGNFILVCDKFEIGKRVIIIIPEFGTPYSNRISDKEVVRDVPIYDSLQWLIGEK